MRQYEEESPKKFKSFCIAIGDVYRLLKEQIASKNKPLKARPISQPCLGVKSSGNHCADVETLPSHCGSDPLFLAVEHLIF
jgi:hypothetical protein